jgi:hypothetical protein
MKVLQMQTENRFGFENISGYVRINVIHSIDIATPARVPSKRGQSQIISSSKEVLKELRNWDLPISCKGTAVRFE